MHLHYIYKITHVDSGKFYIGMHSTLNDDGRYYGSGKLILASIKKYGRDKHIKQILEYCSSRDELRRREKEIVDAALIRDPLCMNLVIGGDGGWSKEASSKAVQAIKIKFSDPEQKRVWGEKMSKILTDLYATGRHKQSGFCKEEIRQEMVKRATSPEANAKRSATMKMKSSGAQNSQYGSQWIHNLSLKENKKISKHEVIPPGWYKGRKMKF